MAFIEFALTFDGYAASGGFEACASRARRVYQEWEADGRLPGDLTELRAALFFAQRAWRWSNEEPFTETEWRYWRALVQAIRALVPESG